MTNQDKRRVLWVLMPCFLLAMVVSACGGGQDATQVTAPPAAATPAAAKPHWGYEGDVAPPDWGKLDPSYATCATGKQQSPIDLASTDKQDIANIKFNYQAVAPKVVNNGHTIEVRYAAGSSINVDGTDYTLAQFHFHTPSEHTLAGQPFPMELHLVHKSAEGKLAVVGVMLKEGAENKQLAAVWAKIPHEENVEADLGANLDPATLLPSDQRTFRYDGSLTTPPCSEGVKWMVMENPVELSKAQIDAFKAIFPLNARPVQLVNDRKLLEDTSSDK